MIGIIARGVTSALGEGDAAIGVMRVGEPEPSRVTRDEELAGAGLLRPFCARAALSSGAGDRATALLERALDSCAAELDEALPGWRTLRVGAAIGTSSGGMRSFERLLDAPPGPPPPVASVLAGTYIGPLVQATRPVPFEPMSLVLGACASSTLAIGLARAWLLDDRCDLVLCGGFDALGVFVAAGFESLRATCGPRGPRPLRDGRDGLALGEAAAVLAVVREEEARRARRVYGWIAGFGATCDATHLTAPDPDGKGLARAALAAIEDAGTAVIELVSAHATATQQNDAAEAKAIVAALGTRATSVPAYSLKGAVGHTLGAAGALEVLSALAAMERGVAPASAGEGAPIAGLCVLDRAERSAARTALKLSSAFGGANGALVLTADPPARRTTSGRDVLVSRAYAALGADPQRLAERTGYDAGRIARADELVRLTLAATAALEDGIGGPGSLRGAGVIVGHGLATFETNARFWNRIRAFGVAKAEPRRFPYTTPNAAAGECAVAFGLTGPAFAVGGGLHGAIEAIGVAADLVRFRVADRVVVVAVDELGDASHRAGIADSAAASGAVALLVSSGERAGADEVSRSAAARLTSWTVRLEAMGSAPGEILPLPTHRTLLPLVSGRPEHLTVEMPWGGFAKASFFWL